MKVLVTGAGGQLGRSVISALRTSSPWFDTVALAKAELDITNETSVFAEVNMIRPDAILHCAAYTNVEAAEDEGNTLNWAVNRDASGYISKAAKDVGARIIYVSTDYVFDGRKSEPYAVTDSVNPLNQYGAAKLAGEAQVLHYSPNATVIRTSWVFEESGKNFVNTMLKLGRSVKTLKVVDDQFGRPTYAPDLARFMVHILQEDVPGGVYHFANDGQATWYEFAKEILKGVDVEIVAVSSDEFPQKAQRPKYSVLSLEKVRNQTSYSIAPWEDALRRFKRSIEL